MKPARTGLIGHHLRPNSPVRPITSLLACFNLVLTIIIVTFT